MKKTIRRAWTLLPGRVRLRLVRATQPKFTASVAVFVLNDRGEVLLLNHVLRPFSGWGLPGGFISHGEQPEAAIRREIREETGIELDELAMYRVRTIGRHVEMLYTARAAGTPRVMSREIIELGWFTADNLPDEVSGPQREQIRKVLRRDD